MRMHTRIKQAYNEVYLDADTKKRVLSQLEVKAMQSEFFESNQSLTEPKQKIVKVTVPLTLRSKRRYPKMIAYVASFAVLLLLVVGGLFVLKGGQSQKNPNVAVSPVDISAEPEVTPAVNTANPETEKIVISQKEFQVGIAKMKKSVFGVAMPVVVYASEDLIIINDYWGMLFYDRKEQKALGVLDTGKYNINHIQGSDYTEIKVSESGNYVSFSNMENKENKYLFDLKNMTLEKGKSLDGMEGFDGIVWEDLKVQSLWQEEIGKKYILGDQFAASKDGKSVWCGFNISRWKDSDEELTMENLVIIQTWSEKIKDSYKHHFDIIKIN